VKKLLCHMLVFLVFIMPSAFISHADTYTVRISPSKGAVLAPGESIKASITVEPVTLTEHKVLWQSENELIASVSSKGVITAHAAGHTTITATIESGDKAKIGVTVTGNQVTKIAIIDSDIELSPGESAQINCTINESADDKSILWTSDDTSVAKVNASGLVTAVGYGTAIITARAANGMTATASVYVPAEVSSVMLDPSELMISPGDSFTLDAYVFPGNARNRTVTWETDNEKIATVDAAGVVTAHKEGTCRIRAKTTNGKYAIANIIVTKVPRTLALSETKIYMNRENRKAQLYPVISPASSADCELTWESSDENVVKVTGGALTATGYGTATITVTSKNNLKAECTVTVSEKVTGISFEENSYILYQNSESKKTRLIFEPSDAIEGIISYTSGNERICKVDKNGVLTPGSVGTTTVTVKTQSGFTAECTVKVVEDTRAISFAHGTYTMTEGGRMKLSVSAQSPSAILPELVWKSSIPEVCAVIDGELYAQKEGATVITAATLDGSLSCLCQVTVLKNPNRQEKVIALTFDNGPGEYTDEILEALDTFGASGTFFLLGKNIPKYPETAALLSNPRHELGNHSYDNQSFNNSSLSEISTSLAKTDAAIMKYIGREATCLRAPDANLAYSLFSTFLDERPFIGWSYKSADMLKTAQADTVAKDAIQNAEDGAILVFHDHSEATAEALWEILATLSGNGYRFVTVSELRSLMNDTGPVFTTKK